jgi:signal transduction histidine kinase
MSDIESLRRFLGIVAHEIRSPLTAIMGYQELLADEIYGTLDERAREPIARIGYAARQILTLTDGMEEIAGRTEAADAENEPSDIGSAVRAAIAEAEREAAGRGIPFDLVMADPLPDVRNEPLRTRDALDMTFFAAIKLASAGGLRVTLQGVDNGLAITITGAGLDQLPLPDHDGDLVITSGAALRLAIARRLLRSLGGSLHSSGAGDTASLVVRLRPAD